MAFIGGCKGRKKSACMTMALNIGQVLATWDPRNG
jgi:hypothetical protein